MKRLLTLALALFALPLAAQTGGWTVMGYQYPCSTGDPTNVLWEDSTNIIFASTEETGPGTNAHPMVTLDTLTNFPSFAPGGLEMKYVIKYGTNGVDFPGYIWAQKLYIDEMRTNNPGHLYWDATPLTITADTPQWYIWSYVATEGSWGPGSNKTAYYNTNCYGCTMQSTNSGTLVWETNCVIANYFTTAWIVTGMAGDGFGNTYITCEFSGSPTLSSYSWGATNVTLSDQFESCLVKLDSSGRVMWAKPYFDTDKNSYFGAILNSVVCDGQGNVIVCGVFGHTLIVDGTTLTGHADTDGKYGSGDIFFVKYNSSGVLQWAKSYGVANNNEGGTTLNVDENDNIYMSGYIGTTTTFDSITVTPGFTGTIGFVGRFSSAGVAQWAESFGEFGELMNVQVACADTNNHHLYISTPTATTNQLIKLNLSDGTYIFHRQITPSGYSVQSIAKDHWSTNILWTGTQAGNEIEAGSYDQTAKTNAWTILTQAGGVNTGIGKGIICGPDGELCIIGKASLLRWVGLASDTSDIYGQGLAVSVFTTTNASSTPVLKWKKLLNPEYRGLSQGHFVIQSPDGNYVISGVASGFTDFGGTVVVTLGYSLAEHYVVKYHK